MRKIYFALITLSIVCFFTSCSNEEDVNGGYSEEEKVKIETLMNLFESYGWVLDTTVSVEQRNKELLEMDYEKTKSFLEYMDNGIEFEKSEPIVNDASDYSGRLNQTRTTILYPIYGSHSSAVATSKTEMVLSYDAPTTSSVTIDRTSVSSNPATTWLPDEYGTFSFSGNKCENIRATGTIKYGSIYSHKYEMIGWCSKNSSGTVNDGAITGFHSI